MAAMVVISVLGACAVNIGEIYNKYGNNMILYGKVQSELYMNSNDKRSDTTCSRLYFREEIQTVETVPGFGYCKCKVNVSGLEGTQSKKIRQSLTGMKPGDAGLQNYERSYDEVYGIRIYAFSEGFRPSLVYVQFRADIRGFSECMQKYIQASAGNNLNNNFSLNTIYKINLRDDSLSGYELSADGQTVFGVTYSF